MNLKNILFGNGEKNTEDGTERLVPVKEIYGGVIALKNGKFVTVLEVLPLNFYLKSELEQKNIISGFAAFLKTAPEELQIIVQNLRIFPRFAKGLKAIMMLRKTLTAAV